MSNQSQAIQFLDIALRFTYIVLFLLAGGWATFFPDNYAALMELVWIEPLFVGLIL